ncbi:MAG: ABC transporter substrate-binding protein [Dehalococcoidia bacterium]
MRARRFAWLVTVIGLVMIAAVTAACGDDEEDAGGDGDAAPAALSAADVDCTALALTAPERIETAGKFVVASDLSYAPIDFVKEGTNEPIGLDADLAHCIAEAWGVDVEIQNVSFDAIIPALTSSKVDVIMSAMTDTEERRKTVDFVDYFIAGSGILVRSGNPESIEALASLCGKQVAIQVGTIQIDEAAEQNASCDKAIDIQTFEQNTDAIQAVVSGRAVAALMDFPVAAYSAANVTGTLVVGEQFNTAPYGFAVRQDDKPMSEGLAAAIDAMRAGGQYDAILEYWSLEAGRLP